MLLFDLSLAQLVAIAVALILGLTFHEFSHAYTADQLGDHRPRALGRVSLNPVDHIDPIGAVVFLLAGFGWAKPVPVNIYALRPGPIGMAIVAAAGPLANVMVALAFGVVYRVLEIAGIGGFAIDIVYWVVFFNFILAILNFIPIPPLDGYNVVLAFLPPQLAYRVQRYAPYGFIVLIALILLPNSPLGLMLDLARPLTQVVIGA